MVHSSAPQVRRTLWGRVSDATKALTQQEQAVVFIKERVGAIEKVSTLLEGFKTSPDPAAFEQLKVELRNVVRVPTYVALCRASEKPEVREKLPDLENAVDKFTRAVDAIRATDAFKEYLSTLWTQNSLELPEDTAEDVNATLRLMQTIILEGKNIWFR